VHTPDYLNEDGSPKDGCAINPDLSNVEGLPPHLWQVDDGAVLPDPKAIAAAKKAAEGRGRDWKAIERRAKAILDSIAKEKAEKLAAERKRLAEKSAAEKKRQAVLDRRERWETIVRKYRETDGWTDGPDASRKEKEIVRKMKRASVHKVVEALAARFEED
jgi:hypothetical protein